MNLILYEYLIYFYHIKSIYNGKDTDYKKIYNLKIYNKNFIERCIIYTLGSFLLPKDFYFILTIPYVQNSIPFNIKNYNNRIFKYILCKNIINFIRQMDDKIVINNYAIKEMMNKLRYNDIKIFLKNCSSVYCLKFLKTNKYIYYKALKFVHYFETNQLFKDYSYDENIIIINNSFKNVDRDIVEKIELINALMTILGDYNKIFYYMYFKTLKFSFMYYISLHIFSFENFPFFSFFIFFYKDIVFYLKYHKLLKK